MVVNTTAPSSFRVMADVPLQQVWRFAEVHTALVVKGRELCAVPGMVR